MDARYRNLQRRVKLGDISAVEPLRRLGIQLGIIPEAALRSLAGFGCPIAREIVPRRIWPTSTSDAFDILFHNIPHNAHTAAVLRYRVMLLAFQRLIQQPDALEALDQIDTQNWDFQLGDQTPLEVVNKAIDLLELMTAEDYYDELCITSQRDYIKGQSSRTGTYYANDPLVLQHQKSQKGCKAVAHSLRDHGYDRLGRAIFSLADAVSPKLAGFEGVYNLNDMLHGIRYYLDGMDYSWSNAAHVDVIWDYYLA